MRINASWPVVDKAGVMAQHFRELLTRLTNNLPILGDGSPEGVVEARLYSLYIDRTATAAPIEYRKMLSDIGGDTTKGWKAV